MSCRPPVLPNCATYSNGSTQHSPRKTNLQITAAVVRLPMTAGSMGFSKNEVARAATRGLRAKRGTVGCRCAQRAAEVTQSFYELLGIPESGSRDDIKRAYKQLARKYHPDVSPPDRAEEYTQCFIMVQEAYETLSDPACRALYDRSLARGLSFAFKARRQSDEELNEKFRWVNRWQDQLSGLRTRSSAKNSEENLSWGARMRRRMANSASD